MKMFGHYKSKKKDSERLPGKPYNSMDSDYEEAEDNPPNYEGREHMRYKEPGFSKHKIDYPEEEPHMKSRVSKEESHEMEDNWHMRTPNQTDRTLPQQIKRARMKMDAPDQEDPKPLLGNLVRNVGAEGVEDTSGEQEMGPNYMQEDEEGDKSSRKKMVVAIMKRKMKKG